MKLLKLVILLFIIASCLTTCKRYPEGGWTNVAKKHLFGKNEKRSAKNWTLNKYEVNGIDSTEFTNCNNLNIEFRIGTTKEEYYSAISYSLYEYGLNFSSNKHKYMKFKQRALASTTMINQYFATGFYRNIFNPTCASNVYFQWEVMKLTKSELILIANDGGNSYKIILNN